MKPIREYNIQIDQDNSINILYHKNITKSGTILYAHGNSGNIYQCTDVLQTFRNHASIILFDYQGFGKSKGNPTEQIVNDNILMVWNFATTNLKIPPNTITLYGNSLGCSVVSWLGQYLLQNNLSLPHTIILQSGFYNLKDITCDIYSKFLTPFLQSKFQNNTYIQKIKSKIPIIIIHSRDDEMINISHANKLIKNCNIDPNNFYIITGDHNNPILDTATLDKITIIINDNPNPNL